MTDFTEERIKETAQLIKERDHATSMLLRWQAKLDDANAGLATILGTETAQATEPESVQE